MEGYKRSIPHQPRRHGLGAEGSGEGDPARQRAEALATRSSESLLSKEEFK